MLAAVMVVVPSSVPKKSCAGSGQVVAALVQGVDLGGEVAGEGVELVAVGGDGFADRPRPRRGRPP